MAVIACPATTIEAPIERVWSLLVDPGRWDAWSDAHFEEAVPDGPVHPGQRWRFSAGGLGRRWPVKMTVTGVEPEQHRLGLDIVLPTGIINEEHITMARLAEDQTRVQFN